MIQTQSQNKEIRKIGGEDWDEVWLYVWYALNLYFPRDNRFKGAIKWKVFE